MEENKKISRMENFLIVLYIVVICIGCFIGNYKNPIVILLYIFLTLPIFAVFSDAIITNIEMKEAEKRQKNIWGGLK